MDDAVKPVLYYKGERITVRGKKQRVPVAEQWVVCLFEKESKFGTKVNFQWCRTDKKGLLYKARADLKWFGDKKQFYVQNPIPPAYTQANYRWRYQPMTFVHRQNVAMFIWPYPEAHNNYVTIKQLVDQGLLLHDKIKRGQQAVFLNCSLEIYLHRMRHYTKILNKHIVPYQKRVAGLFTCGTLYDQAYHYVVAKGKAHQVGIAGYALKEGKGSSYQNGQDAGRLLNLPNFEAQMIAIGVFDRLKQITKNQLKEYTRVFRRQTERPAQILGAILRSKHHDLLFRRFDWKVRSGRTIDGKYEMSHGDEQSYNDAYIAIFRCQTKLGKGLYDMHFADILKASQSGKSAAMEALKKVGATGSWAKNMTDGVLKITAAARTAKMSQDLTSLDEGLKGALNYLEARGILVPTSADFSAEKAKLGVALTRSQKYNISVDASSYYTCKFDTGAVGEVKAIASSGLAAVTTVLAFQKQSKNIRDDVEKAKEAYGLVTSVADIPMIQNRIPAGAVISKGAGAVGAGIDWGISIYDMSAAADKGEGQEFAFSVVSYAGKGILFGGTVLLLTPAAPLGVVLVAVGAVITILSDGFKAAYEWKSVDERQFRMVLDELFKRHDPTKGKYLYSSWGHMKKEKIGALLNRSKKYAAFKAENPHGATIMEKIGKENTLDQYLQQFFTGYNFGVNWEILNK
jgi:hypothetical protein